jgi:drug/metabolite transporter (DMT)-like permease
VIDLRIQRYALLALAAAALFGASTPLAKVLVGTVSPVVLAGLLYLGSGLGLGAVIAGRSAFGRAGGSSRAEAPIGRTDLPWLAGAIVAGGILAPAVLLWGLTGTTASGASLLLNFEGVITTLIAGLLFGEAIGRRVWLAALVMLVAGALLVHDPHEPLRLSVHAMGIVAACLLWALDNNFTRKIAGADPVQIAAIKGITAGATNLAVGLGAGGALPGVPTLAAAAALGFASYGVSLVLFIYALRHLGAARTAAHFSTAPFMGAALAAPLLGEPVTSMLAAAAALMAIATWLVLTETHEHEHSHEHTTHTHRHVHDEHHQHAHRGDEGPEPHAHEHAHGPLTHRHPHLPDLHHRHGHR